MCSFIQMGLLPEAIIGLVTLFVTCAPSTFLLLAGSIDGRRTVSEIWALTIVAGAVRLLGEIFMKSEKLQLEMIAEG
jgi:hypothetical protein